MTERSTHATVGCPHCRARYRVYPTDLAAAQGRLRCGACLKVFRAAGTSELPDPPAVQRAAFPAWAVVGLVIAVAVLAVQIIWLQTDYRARDLTVSRHVESPGVLALQFVILHDAPISAPLPTLDVAFAAADGAPVGSRRFRPAEYLELQGPQPERLARLRLLAPETAHPISLHVPHPGAVAAKVTISFPSRFTMDWRWKR